jgi:DNA-binding IclR family transcriptional regulator
VAKRRTPPAKTARTIPALSRGLRALKILAAAGESGVSFSDLGRQLDDLPAPTLSRLLKALVAEQYVAKTAAGLYARGAALESLARALGTGGTLEELAVEVMNAYAHATGESIGFARFFGDRLVMTEKVEVADSFKLAQYGYAFRPAENEGPTIVVAAHLAGQDFNRFARAANSQIASMVEFRRLAAAYRKSGVQVEPMPHRPVRGGPRRAAVAVLDPGGKPVGELHTVVPGAHFARDNKKIVAALLRAAENFAARLDSVAL